MFRHVACLRCLIFRVEPLGIALRLLHHGVKLVLPRRRAEKQRPALPIGERRPQHLTEDPRRHQTELVQHDAIEVEPAQRIWVICPKEPHLAPRRIRHGEVGDRHLTAWNRGGKVGQIVPDNRLRLLAKWGQKPEARPLALALERGNLEMVDREDRLAEPPMADHGPEPMTVHAGMNRRLELARLIR